MCVGVGMPAVLDAAAVGAALAAGRPLPSLPGLAARCMANSPASLLAARYGLAGPLAAPATACAAGASALADAAALIASGAADVALAGGADACVDAVTLAGFAR